MNRQWAREGPDLDVSPIGVIGRMSRLARLFEQEITRNLADMASPPTITTSLATLRRSGKPYGRGLIERVPDPSDRRGVIARLTTAGERLVDRASVKHYQGEHRLLAALSPGERDTLAGLLRTLAEANGC